MNRDRRRYPKRCTASYTVQFEFPNEREAAKKPSKDRKPDKRFPKDKDPSKKKQ